MDAGDRRRRGECVSVEDGVFGSGYQWRRLGQQCVEICGGTGYRVAKRARGPSKRELRDIRWNRNSEANRAIGLSFLVGDGPIRRKRQRWLAKIRGDAVAMPRIDTDRETFARNDFTTIGNGIEAQSGDHRQSCVYFVALA